MNNAVAITLEFTAVGRIGSLWRRPREWLLIAA